MTDLTDRADDRNRLQGTVRTLHRMSKRRWGLSLLLAMVALLPIPVVTLILGADGRWIGLVLACVFVVGGKVVGRHDSIIGAEAGRLQRMVDYHRALGCAIDRNYVTELGFKYRALENGAKGGLLDKFYNHDETKGADDCPIVSMATMVIESSWWTEKLARRMITLSIISVVVTVVLSLIFVMYTWSIGITMNDGIVGLVVFVIVAVELIVLCWRYSALAKSSSDTHDVLRRRMENIEGVDDAMTFLLGPINDYFIVRDVGPPILEWVYRRNQTRLKALWAKRGS